MDYNDLRNSMEDNFLKKETRVRAGELRPDPAGAQRDRSITVGKAGGGDMEVGIAGMAFTGPRADGGIPEEMSASGLPPQRNRASAPRSTLKKGVYNNDAVRALQVSLADIAAATNLTQLDPGAADADFGGNTERAVKAFQKEFGLDVTGVADDATVKAIQAKRSEIMMGGAGPDRMGVTDIMGESSVAPVPPAPRVKVGSSGFTSMLNANLSHEQIDALRAARVIGHDIAEALKAKTSASEQSTLASTLGYDNS